MDRKRVVIVGGGLAGLSAGCYAQANGFDATIVEHGLSLGGVCTSWTRGPYVIDGCIHWLTGGAFTRIYEELGILPAVPLRVIDHFMTLRDERFDHEVELTRDLDAFAAQLRALTTSAADEAEINRLVGNAKRFGGAVTPPIEPRELDRFGGIAMLWGLRRELPELAHYRKPLREWCERNLREPRVRETLLSIAPPDGPAMLLLFMLGYLHNGWLSRPVGGTAAFRDALIASYRRLGGETRLHATVDEVLVHEGRAAGVRLDDGTEIPADVVVSTSSMPETVLRLLGGAYEAEATRRRMERWPMFRGIVLASFGVETPLADRRQMLLFHGFEPFEIGGFTDRQLYVRVCNDDPSFAPPGHAVVQAMVASDYDWWATRGTRYTDEKDRAAATVLAQLEKRLPEIRGRVRVTDVATPLTYWKLARSWRGAFEGWLPNPESLTGYVPKTLRGLAGFFMAGQWVEPGGGVPVAVLSGRQAMELVCAEDGRPFHTPAAATAEGVGATLH